MAENISLTTSKFNDNYSSQKSRWLCGGIYLYSCDYQNEKKFLLVSEHLELGASHDQCVVESLKYLFTIQHKFWTPNLQLLWVCFT